MNNDERLTSEIHKAIAALKGQSFENRSDYLQTIREAVARAARDPAHG
jgi:hypothetical protein